MTRSLATIAAAGALLAAPLAAQACGGGADEPVLARMGNLPVGVTTITISDPGRPDLAASTPQRTALADRQLSVWIWYPAKASGQPTRPYIKRLHHLGQPDQEVTLAGCALPEAEPLKSGAPLVVLSHGYGGWGTYLVDLAETLASRGYVVASIEHNDLPVTDMPSFALSFASTTAHRSDDQRAVIERLIAMASQADFPLSGAYDPGNLALIGYSMGGFGALATAGAGYDPAAPFSARLPPGLLGSNAEGARPPIANLKAMVLIAPWGGQAENRAWSRASLAKVTAPTLVVVGDQDDVSGYADGVLGLYGGLINADRRLLTFQNARHNLVGVDVPDLPRDKFDLIERFEEPVWRKDRLRAITRHYVVAFLDESLRHDRAADDFLKPTAPGATPKGFERRWALGFRFEQAGR